MNTYIVHIACWIDKLRLPGELVELSDADAAAPLRDKWITKQGDTVDKKVFTANKMVKPKADNGEA